MTKNCNDSINDIIDNIITSIMVEKPCKVINVRSTNYVDVEYYDNNKKDILTNVPVKHLQTNNAYIYLGIKSGDYGTLRFFDNNISEYLKGTNTISTEAEWHGINNSLFSSGFYPDEAQYIFPDEDLVIGTPCGATIAFSEDSIIINGENITIEGGNVTITGDTVIDQKTFLTHTHSNGNNGNPTGGVI